MTRALFVFLLTASYLLPSISYADTASDIQAQIDANNKQIAALQADIAAFQKEIDVLGTKKNTLQSTINSLALSQKQLASQIQITQSKISSANLKIKSLTNSIGDKEAIIVADQNAIAKALRSIAEGEQTPLVVQLISSNSLGEAWQVADHAILFNRALGDDVADLRIVRKTLSSDRDEVTAAKTSLLSLQSDLTLQKKSVDLNKVAQQKLLADTKNQESNYQKLIAQKQAAEKSFEQELINLQGQLNLIVHPGLLPEIGSGVLSWPFSNAFMLGCARLKGQLGNPFCITQYFGNTAFSTANPQIYKGKGHNAIDIGAPIGTPIHAALGGTVLGAGNTDLVRDSKGRQCWSFGKWVMIVHGNGLSTLYSHLSTIDVSKGQSVDTGDVVGLSGMTGSATGPHLHFGVYATEGTQIMDLGKFQGKGGTPCTDGGVILPVAKLDAYLNPLSYL